MSEFSEFIEHREIDPNSAAPKGPTKATPVWDGWGTEEDRQRFYKLHGVDAPTVEEEAAAAQQRKANQVPKTKTDPDDGWG